MKNFKNPKTSQYEISEGNDGSMTVHLKGRMDAASATTMIEGLSTLIERRRPPSLILDLENVPYFDDFGVLVFVALKNMMERERGHFYIINPSDKAQKILSIHHFDAMGGRISFAKKSSPSMVVRLGQGTLQVASDFKYLISFIGSVCLALMYVCMHPKSLRTDDTFTYMQKTGVDALPIVGLISFLLGLILAFMSAIQLKQYGADIYVASFVSLAMVCELGPIMTAIIVAGRSGSAFAAEIGTMKVSEEVDALFTMGFEPTRFLVVPKIIASVIVIPLLTLFADLFAIMGSLLVGVFMLKLTANAFIIETFRLLKPIDVLWSFVKSGVFGLLIAWIGCLRGFQVRGGAASVGQATTSAVVSSLFLIILSDSLFAVIRIYWG